ncbi:MAG: hypothetical protein AAGE59_05715 [Cyanobacteria bacterium P01_F01_bin.86]
MTAMSSSNAHRNSLILTTDNSRLAIWPNPLRVLTKSIDHNANDMQGCRMPLAEGKWTMPILGSEATNPYAGGYSAEAESSHHSHPKYPIGTRHTERSEMRL